MADGLNNMGLLDDAMIANEAFATFEDAVEYDHLFNGMNVVRIV